MDTADVANFYRWDSEAHIEIGGLEMRRWLLLFGTALLFLAIGLTVVSAESPASQLGGNLAAPPGQVPGQAAILAGTGVISGKVTAYDGGAGLDGCPVTIYTIDGTQVESTTTDINGNYSTSASLSGGYKVGFGNPWWDSDYLFQYYDSHLTVATADVVQVPDAGSVSVNTALHRSGRIIGRVTAADSGQPLAGVYISAYDYNNGRVAYAWTNTQGDYVLSRGIRAGLYRLLFEPPWNSAYLKKWFFVSTSDGDTAVDTTLAHGGYIVGTITSDGSTPLPGRFVEVYEANNYASGVLARATSDDQGKYATGPSLPDGNYKVKFLGGGSYLEEFYQDAGDQGSATPVTVTAGSAPPVVDATLQAGGTVSGLVTSGGVPCDCTVTIYDSAGKRVTDVYAIAGNNGLYQAFGLPGGDYRVLAKPAYGTPYAPRYYPGPVHVNPASSTDNINVDLAPEGTISGKVTADGGGPIAGIAINVYRAGGYDAGAIAWATSDANGDYTVSRLSAGEYWLEFKSSSLYQSEYFDNTLNRFESRTVTLTTGGSATANASLGLAGAITGRVIASDTGQPLPEWSTRVTLYDSSGNYLVYTWPDAQGYYNFVGLQSGNYRVGASTTTAGYAPQFYPGKNFLSLGENVTAAPGGWTTGIDFNLQLGGQISGTVTGPTGSLSSWVRIGFYDADHYSSSAIAWASANGWNPTYTSPTLPAGRYYVEFGGGEWSPYLREYYDDKGSLATADAVTVVVGPPTSNVTVSAEMAMGSLVSGKVTTGDYGHGVKGARVEVYDAGGRLVSSGISEWTGFYKATTGLGPGTYTVRASGPAPLLASQTTVVVPESRADVGGVDLNLAAGGRIAGTVIGQDPDVGLSGVLITVYSGNGQSVAEVTTDGEGNYTSPALPAGNYKVGFRPGPLSVHRAEYYSGRPDFGTAASVPVRIGSTTTVNASLLQGGQSMVFLPLVRK